MGGRSVTAGFGANQEPLADAHGSERSRDRKRAVAGYRKKPDGRRTSGSAAIACSLDRDSEEIARPIPVPTDSKTLWMRSSIC